MTMVKLRITRRVMVAGQARSAGEVVELPPGDAFLLQGIGKAVPVTEPEPEPKPRRRARTGKGQFQGDDPATPDVNEAWAE